MRNVEEGIALIRRAWSVVRIAGGLSEAQFGVGRDSVAGRTGLSFPSGGSGRFCWVSPSRTAWRARRAGLGRLPQMPAVSPPTKLSLRLGPVPAGGSPRKVFGAFDDSEGAVGAHLDHGVARKEVAQLLGL